MRKPSSVEGDTCRGPGKALPRGDYDLDGWLVIYLSAYYSLA